MNRYILPVFLVLMAVGVYVIYIDPFYESIRVGNAKIVEYDNLIANAHTATAQIEKLKAIQESFPSGYDRSLATILPPTVDPLRLVIDVNGIAALRGLHVKSPSVSVVADLKKQTGVQKHALSFSISAPYSVFRSFLRDLEIDLALQDLSQLSFSSEASSDSAANVPPELRVYDYTVNVITYSLPQ